MFVTLFRKYQSGDILLTVGLTKEAYTIETSFFRFKSSVTQFYEKIPSLELSQCVVSVTKNKDGVDQLVIKVPYLQENNKNREEKNREEKKHKFRWDIPVC